MRKRRDDAARLSEQRGTDGSQSLDRSCPSDLWHRAAETCTYIDDDWPEYLRAFPNARDDRAKILWLLRWNRSREQIAQILAISESTINWHVTQLRALLNVPDWRDAAAKISWLVTALRQREGRAPPWLRVPGPKPFPSVTGGAEANGRTPPAQPL